MGSPEREKGLKRWVSGAKFFAWKRGSWGRHVPASPSNVSAPPPGLISFLKMCQRTWSWRPFTKKPTGATLWINIQTYFRLLYTTAKIALTSKNKPHSDCKYLTYWAIDCNKYWHKLINNMLIVEKLIWCWRYFCEPVVKSWHKNLQVYNTLQSYACCFLSAVIFNHLVTYNQIQVPIPPPPKNVRGQGPLEGVTTGCILPIGHSAL